LFSKPAQVLNRSVEILAILETISQNILGFLILISFGVAFETGLRISHSKPAHYQLENSQPRFTFSAREIQTTNTKHTITFTDEWVRLKGSPPGTGAHSPLLEE